DDLVTGVQTCALPIFTTAHDVGTIINQIGHQGQIEGGFIQGLGYALMEEIKTEEGRITTLSLGDVKLPTIQDIPPLTTVILEDRSEERRVGKGRHSRW